MFKTKTSVLIACAVYSAAVFSFADSFQLEIGRMFAQGRTSDIEEALQRRISENPQDPGPWLELADLDVSQGNDAGAMAAYQSYLARKDDWAVQKALALTRERMGDFANARDSLLALHQAHGDDPELLWGLARLCLYQSKWKSIRTQPDAREALKEAQGYLRSLCLARPHFAMALWQWAEVSRALGDTQEALEAYQKTLQEDGSYKKAHRYIARLLARQGRYRESLAKYEQAMAVEPEDGNLKKEAQRVSRLAPRVAQARKQERMKQWTDWEPPEEKPIAPSAVTLRVGILTGMGNLLIRGVSDLRVVPAPGSPLPAPAVEPPGQAPLSLVLQGGQDYDISYERARPHGKPQDRWKIKDGEGKTLASFDQRLWFLPLSPDKPILLHAVPSNPGYFFAREEDRAYRGVMEILPRPGQGFNVVNRVSLEDYTAGVLPSEMVSSWPMEALKSQAVVIRSYALSRVGWHDRDGFDVTDDVHDQVYRGLRAEGDRTNEAVKETAGLVLRSGGRVVPAVFSAQCGGHTQDYEEAWGFKNPVVGVCDFDPRFNQDMEFPLSPRRMESWIKEDREAWCRVYGLKGYQNYRWTWVVSAEDIGKRIPEIGRVRGMAVTRRSTAGWAEEIRVEGAGGVKKIEGDSIRRYLGGIRSNLIWIEPQFNLKGWPEEFIVYGGGWGHGVGLCQVGCYGLAKAGKDYREILRHYFPKGNVEKLEPGVTEESFASHRLTRANNGGKKD